MLPMTNHPEPALAVKSMKDATGEILSFDVTEETFTPHDVVLGKGNGINCLPGNVKFREIISKYKPLYTSTPRSLKGTVAELVINEIACLEPPGRFLEPQADKRFKQVARKRAIEKTCQALREKKTGTKLLSTTAVASAKATATKSNCTVGPPSPTTAPVSPPVTQHAPTAVAATPSPRGSLVLAPPSIPLQPTASTAAPPTTSHLQPVSSQQQQQNGGAPTLSPSSSAATPMQYAQGNVDPNASGRQSADPDEKQPVWPIRENDVLYGGRGRKHFHRQANQRFLELIKISRNEYRESSNKKLVAIGIINQWKTKQDPPGRFLQQDGAGSETWYEIPSAKIQEKTCQALRDLKRERGPGGARATIADRMVDPRSSGSNSSRSSSTASQSSSDENSSKGSNSSCKSQKKRVQQQQVHRSLPQSQQQQPPPQQQHQLAYRPQQQPLPQPQQQQAYHHHGFPPYQQQHHQPMYSQPSPPQQHQQVYHHPTHLQQVSPLSPHSQIAVSYQPMPMQSVGAPSPPGPHGPPPHSPQQHMPVNHYPHHVSQAHVSPGQHGWVQDRNSRMYSQPAPQGGGMMLHDGHAPPMGQHQQHNPQNAHSMSRQAPPVHHLPARPHPPPPAYQVHNHAHSHRATPGAPPPPQPPQYNTVNQDPHAAAIHRQASIVAQEMRKMDEMMRRQPSAPPPPPPPPPPAAGNMMYQESSHSQAVPRTVVTAAPPAPHSPPNHNHGQPPSHYQAASVAPHPPQLYSPSTPAANHGGVYHEASYQQTHHSVVSTGDGSSISMTSSSGDMSAPSSSLPSKEEMTRQVAMTTTSFAPIHSGGEEKSAASRTGQHQAPLPRVVPPSVPVSLPRQHAGMQHNKMISLENKVVPLQESPQKDDKATSTSIESLPSKPTTAPPKEGKESSDEDNRAQGELEAASLLANMFAV